MIAPRPHRRRSAEVPGGTILDIASVGTIEPTRSPPTRTAAEVTRPDQAPSALPEIVHRKRPRVTPIARPELMESDLDVSFAPTPPRRDDETPADAPAPMSWTPQTGFVDTPAPERPRMRLVGQRGDFEDAIAGLTNEQRSPDPVEVPPHDAAVRYLPAPGERSVIEDVPPEVARVVAHATGVQVGDAKIDRSPAVSVRAAEIGAIAFTESATVHLPDELGSLDQPTTRAIVAHELTHVAQQRRMGPSRPVEGTADGDELEAEARSVQRAVRTGGPVRPTFMRNRSSVPSAPAGVQRLVDDEDPYAWQDRPDRSLETTTGMLGGLFGIHLSEDTRTAERDRASERRWAQNFEREHADGLQSARDDRWYEIREEAEEAAVDEARRREEAVKPLKRRDHIALRQRLDEERPFEFGFPPGIDRYPEDLPDAEDDEDDHPTVDHDDEDDDDDGAGSTGRHAGIVRSSTPPAIGRASVSGRLPRQRSRRRPGSRGDEDPYGWQHRDETETQIATTLFGGLLGGFLGAESGTEEEQRERAERNALDRMMPRRQQKERELRHARLRDVRAQVLRERDDDDVEPVVGLHREDIIGAREQVDADMPLEFADAEYVDMEEDAHLGPAGFIEGRPREDDESPIVSPVDEDEDGDEDGDIETPDSDEAAATENQATDTAAPAPATGQSDELDETDETDSGDAPVAPTRSGAAGAPAMAGAVAAAAAASDAMADDDDSAADIEEQAAAHIFADASELDIDVLARRLYGRLRRDLRHELLIDRERTGALADVR